MGKYALLLEHLTRSPASQVEMTFDEIDALVGGLPVSAVRHQAWWSNEVAGSHVQARAWMEAGREVVAVDRQGRRVLFSASRHPEA